MSQHDMVIANQTFPSFRADVNDALQALASTSKGNTRPPTVYAGQLWIDDNTPSSSLWTLYLYDGTHDVPVGLVDTTAGLFTPLQNPFAGTAGGSGNAVTLALTPARTAYLTGEFYTFIAANANTGATTVNIDSLGAKNVTVRGSATLPAGSIRSGMLCVIQYDGTRFQLLNPALDAATQSTMEAGSSTTTFVPPGLQQFHPSAAKFWVKHDDGTTIAASYNVSSITDNGTGDHTVNFSNAFSSADYCVVALSSTVTHPCQDGSAPAAGSVRIHTRTPGPSSVLADAGRYYVAGFGDQ